MRPHLVAHADWSASASGCWSASARLRGDTYVAGAPAPVGDPRTLLTRLQRQVSSGSVLAGFDFPIGVPAAYARRAGVLDFVAFLGSVGHDDWDQFFDVAAHPDEIAIRRPFYPRRPGGTSREHLTRALDLEWDELLRRCDRRHAGRGDACALFWTLGGNQVGKAAISGWRDVLQPALRTAERVALWPFDGGLDELLEGNRVVVAETYPTEFFGHLGISLGGMSKRNAADRATTAEPLLRWASDAGVEVTEELRNELHCGFTQGGDDAFDAVLGLFGMLNIVLGRRTEGAPEDADIRRIEGWMLGVRAGDPTSFDDLWPEGYLEDLRVEWERV